MAKTADTLTFDRLTASLRAATGLAPVYLIHGEEGFYADRLVGLFEALVPEADRDFNLTTVYAPETPMAMVHEACRRFPMMADRQVVIVKECQSAMARDLEKLIPYLTQPSPQTVLALIFRGAKAKPKELATVVKKAGGVVFEGTPLRDRDVMPMVEALVREAGLHAEPAGLSLLCDHIGPDLARLYNEIDKLRLCLPPGGMVTPEAVERHVGVSRVFNNFELSDALVKRDAKRAMRIAAFFAANPKDNPLPVTLAVLFNQFSNILIWHFSPDKSEAAIMKACGFRTGWQVRLLGEAARRFNASQALDVIGALRLADTRSKGIGSRQDPYDLLRDLVFRILHS